MSGGSTRVILTALAANVGIAIAKFVAAGITGSSAMLTEGIHSLVDSTNHVLLLYGTKRATAPPDKMHPLGYGRELYFWSFVVAILVFALGSGVSVYEGLHHIRNPEPLSDPLVAYVVLAFAFILEGWSTMVAFRDFNAVRGKQNLWQAIRSSKDAPTIVILLENSGAMVGIVVATIGLAISHASKNPAWDGAASVLIGIILGLIAILLAVEAKGLLIGESADPALIGDLRRIAEQGASVEGVGDVITIHHAPDRIMACIDIDFVDAVSAADVERSVAAIEAAVARELPTICRVFIRPVESVAGHALS